jgi:hypothetical protein
MFANFKITNEKLLIKRIQQYNTLSEASSDLSQKDIEGQLLEILEYVSENRVLSTDLVLKEVVKMVKLYKIIF